jgi:hypothetical protein
MHNTVISIHLLRCSKSECLRVPLAGDYITLNDIVAIFIYNREIMWGSIDVLPVHNVLLSRDQREDGIAFIFDDCRLAASPPPGLAIKHDISEVCSAPRSRAS